MYLRPYITGGLVQISKDFIKTINLHTKQRTNIYLFAYTKMLCLGTQHTLPLEKFCPQHLRTKVWLDMCLLLLALI